MYFAILLIYVCFILFTEGTCNSVQFDISLDLFTTSTDIGSIILSTNRCQAIKTKFGSLTIIGALKASCISNDKIEVEFFSDIYCKEFKDASYLSLNESFTISSILRFTLTEKTCEQGDCSIDFTFAQNCTLTSSNNFLNASVPFDLCMSLNNTFDSYSQAVINNIIPSSIIQWLSQSVKLSCCSDDQSLLITNYSDYSCSNELGRIRLSKEYANACFRLSQSTSSKNQYIALINWECADTVDCTNVPYVQNDSLPSKCDSTCISNLYPNENVKEVTNSKNSNVKTGVIVGSVLGVVFFVILLYGVYWFTRRKRIREEVSKQASIMSTDNAKYEPMISDDGTNNEVNENDPTLIGNTGTHISVGNGIHIHDNNDHIENNNANDVIITSTNDNNKNNQ